MFLPLVSLAAGIRGRRRLAGAAAGIVLLAGWAAAAQTAAPTPTAAPAQPADPYSATVKVDATAADVVKARDLARLNGQRNALGNVLDRLAGGSSKTVLPTLSDSQITDMVVSFEVADERMSTVRYTADYTFHFRPADVQRALQTAGIAVPENGAAPAAGALSPPGAAPVAAGQPALILPVYKIGTQAVLWEDPNPWRDAWTQLQESATASSALTVPLADVGDLTAIDGDKAVAGDGTAIATIGHKYGADVVLVATAAARGPAAMPLGLDVSVKQYRAGRFVDVHILSLAANPGESANAFFLRTAQTVAAAIGNNWQGMVAQEEPQNTLTASVAIDSLEEWLRLRDQIAGLPPIRKVTLRSLSRQQATVEIGYVGDIDGIKTALSGIGLDLVQGESGWRLSRAVPPGPQ